MKHIFIINPKTKSQKAEKIITEYLEFHKNDLDSEIYITKQHKDATRFVKEYISKHKNEELRFYACGGDGTINEVANGIYGEENVSMSAYPCGSGNDFIKAVGGADIYKNLDKNIKAKDKLIDLIKVNGEYCVNVCNFGLDAVVCNIANKVNRNGGKNGYTKGVVYALFKGRKNKATVVADGKVINPDGKFMLCTVANGDYVGGKYKCAPRYSLNDGLLEVCLVDTISIPKFLTMMGPYTKGKHLEDKRFNKIIHYTKAKTVEMYADEPFFVCIDGEMLFDKKFTVETIHNAIHFAMPE